MPDREIGELSDVEDADDDADAVPDVAAYTQQLANDISSSTHQSNKQDDDDDHDDDAVVTRQSEHGSTAVHDAGDADTKAEPTDSKAAAENGDDQAGGDDGRWVTLAMSFYSSHQCPFCSSAPGDVGWRIYVFAYQP